MLTPRPTLRGEPITPLRALRSRGRHRRLRQKLASSLELGLVCIDLNENGVHARLLSLETHPPLQARSTGATARHRSGRAGLWRDYRSSVLGHSEGRVRGGRRPLGRQRERRQFWRGYLASPSSDQWKLTPAASSTARNCSDEPVDGDEEGWPPAGVGDEVASLLPEVFPAMRRVGDDEEPCSPGVSAARVTARRSTRPVPREPWGRPACGPHSSRAGRVRAARLRSTRARAGRAAVRSRHHSSGTRSTGPRRRSRGRTCTRTSRSSPRSRSARAGGCNFRTWVAARACRIIALASAVRCSDDPTPGAERLCGFARRVAVNLGMGRMLVQPRRRHSYCDMLSPADYEAAHTAA